MTDNKIKKYWDNVSTQSMYDKNLLEIETRSILDFLSKKDTVIDIGCGEGEGTANYYKKVKKIVALDYSKTRLSNLKERNKKILTFQMDMKNISEKSFDIRFDKAITQRSLINLDNFGEQKRVIKGIHAILKKNGAYIMLEGFQEGVEELNKIREEFSLKPIDIKWHNLFFNKKKLLSFMKPYFKLEHSRDFSLYFFLTRGFNAIAKHPDIPQWKDIENNIAKEMEIKYKNQFMKGVSRLELLVFKKL